MQPPFEKLYVAVAGQTKRVYHRIGSAKSLITNSLSSSTDPNATFKVNVELWSLDHTGWHLEFNAQAGESLHVIPWKTAAKRRISEKERKAKFAEERDRALYNKLKRRFD